MAVELRCDGNKLHGVLTDDGVLEVVCGSRFCGKRPGNVVVHRFDMMAEGKIIETKFYKDYPTVKEKG